MQSPLFQKRHYIALAEAFHAIPKSSRSKVAAEAVASMLAIDNPNFDRERFLHACETGEVLGRNIRGGPAMPYGPTSGAKWDRKLRR